MNTQTASKRREREPDTNDEPPNRRRRLRDAATTRTEGGGAASIESAQPENDPGPGPLQDLDATIGYELPQSSENVLNAVVKVFCVHSEPNFSLPWQRKRQFSSTSSGFIIEGRRILTNAHSVDHHCQVRVRRRGSETKFIAKVLAQGPECDIALLTVEDENFWSASIEAVQFGVLPRLQDSVSVVGFPIGGETMSVTSGVVSRIEVTSYSHSGTALLGMQIDAAINSGNSGGPAFNKKGECIGIAFQTLKSDDAENIGYVIPVDVVQHFITDFDRNGRFTNFPILGIEWQKLESPYLRRSLRMKELQKGILVREVEPTAPTSAFIQRGDVLLTFDGIEVANDGTVQFRSGERISFSYLVSKKFTNDIAVVEILRNGEVLTSELKLSHYHRLVPEHLDNTPPPYFILAGFVFTQVTAPYLRSEYGKDYDYDSPVKLLDLLMHGKCQTLDDQVVVLGQVLAADCTVGYEEHQNYRVYEVNGIKIKNLRELMTLVESCSEPFLSFRLEYNAVVVIDTKEARALTKEIMDMHYIPHDRSVDLREPQVANGIVQQSSDAATPI